ncbi:MFS transporter [Streptomyces sp. NPDC060028]|uniref:MFS transporter n=1 Tax=Streptomyces sp. NPDC060028 TaxID=3347041 RepID=UPI0036C7F005
MAVPSPATTTGASAAPTPGRGLLPPLLVGNSATYALYVGVAGALLALQVEHVDPAHKVSDFGLIAGVSALFATIFNPVAGALSDRTGRRNPWILGGGLAAIPAMFLLGTAHTILLTAIAWCLGRALMNIYRATVTSVVRDRVPWSVRGKASAAVGLGLPFGSALGALLGAAFCEDHRTGYLVFGVLVAGAAVLFTSRTRAKRLPARARKPARAQLAAFTGALKDHGLRWAFIGRALLVLGYFSVGGYQLYILQDHTVLPDGMKPEEAVALLMPLTSVSTVVSAVAGGYLTDRFERRTLFVGASALLSAVALVIPAVSTSWTAMPAFAVVNGLAFGCHMAVDTALVTVAPPRAEDAARDMGGLDDANAGPQIVAPFTASAIVSLSGGYTAMFVVAAFLAAAGALAVKPIRSVRQGRDLPGDPAQSGPGLPDQARKPGLWRVSSDPPADPRQLSCDPLPPLHSAIRLRRRLGSSALRDGRSVR